jgi:hypothetical protein
MQINVVGWGRKPKKKGKKKKLIIGLRLNQLFIPPHVIWVSFMIFLFKNWNKTDSK